MQNSPLAVADGLFGRMSKTDGLVAAAWVLGIQLGKGRQLDAKVLRTTMEHTFQGSDADGLWDWRDAYEAAELAQVLYLRRHAASIVAPQINPADSLAALKALSGLAPSQTRRSERQLQFQQFSTPVDLAYVASIAADARPEDVVLEPSAGTGLLAIYAELAGARLHLNELDEARASLLDQLFRDTAVTRLNGEQINDRLNPEIRPTVVIMNPPFSVSPGVAGRTQRADFRHIEAALARLERGGRLVAITGAGLSPEEHPDLYSHLRDAQGQVVFTRALDGSAYARHGTTTDTRLTVIDKREDAAAPASSLPMAEDSADLLASLSAVPERLGVSPRPARTSPPVSIARPTLRPAAATFQQPASVEFPGAELVAYTARTLTEDIEAGSQGIYEAYTVATIDIEGAANHPSTLVESAAMSAVRFPMPTYQPRLPRQLVTGVGKRAAGHKLAGTPRLIRRHRETNGRHGCRFD